MGMVSRDNIRERLGTAWMSPVIEQIDENWRDTRSAFTRQYGLASCDNCATCWCYTGYMSHDIFHL